MSQGRRAPGAVLLLSFALACPPAGTAQTFEDGLEPRDVIVRIVPRPYDVHGDTPAALTAALRALGLGGSWMRTSSFYIWHYALERMPFLFLGEPSEQCRIPSFSVDMRFTIEYPRWVRPPNADTLLVQAWDAFAELMERDWVERRDDVYAQLTELNRIARRMEVDCPAADMELDKMMDRLSEESWRTATRERERGERVVLSWPPPGFESEGSEDRSRAFRVASATTVEHPPTDAERLLEDAQMDAQRPAPGGLLVVAGLHRGGRPVYFEDAVNAPSATGTPIDASVPRAYPGLTEVFVATLAAAFDSAGVVDLTAPIATYLPSVDPSVGRVTLRQLLAHRSGVHNAKPDSASGLDWPETARALDGRALFTEPGAVYSYSGYDYPLAMWVLESVTRTDFPNLARSALFEPLGMANTSIGGNVRGLPVTLTTPSDLMIFLAAWVGGELRGAPALSRGPAAIAEEGQRSFDSGVWYDEAAGVERVSLACGAGAFQIFPATGTAFTLWTSARWPNGIWRYLLSQVGEQEGAREAVLRPVDVQGTGRLGAVDPPCQEPTALKEDVLMLGAHTPSGAWPGRYRNGDQIMQLSERDGLLKVTNGDPLDVSHYRGDVHFVGANGIAFYPLRLTRDTEGRRYLVLDGRAYIHEEDRPAAP